MAEYRQAFEIMSLYLEDLSEANLIEVFINGLDDRIKAELLGHPRESLKAVVELAQTMEVKSAALSQGRKISLPKLQLGQGGVRTQGWASAKVSSPSSFINSSTSVTRSRASVTSPVNKPSYFSQGTITRSSNVGTGTKPLGSGNQSTSRYRCLSASEA